MRQLVSALCHHDTTAAMAGYVIISYLFGQPFDVAVLAFAIVCAYLPDVDLVPYLAIRHVVGRRRLTSHWVIGHHPPLVIPLAGALGWFLGSKLSVSPTYMATLGGVLTFMHFVNDSFHPVVGLHWLSPFSWRRWSFAGGRARVTPMGPVRAHYEQVLSWDGQDDVVKRLPSLTFLQIITFVISLSSLLMFSLL